MSFRYRQDVRCEELPMQFLSGRDVCSRRSLYDRCLGSQDNLTPSRTSHHQRQSLPLPFHLLPCPLNAAKALQQSNNGIRRLQQREILYHNQ